MRKYVLLFLLTLSVSINIYFFIRFVGFPVKGDSKMVLVEKVIDGDTFDAEEERYRFASIDAPEYPKRCYSLQAKDRLTELILGKEIKIEEVGKDHFGRALVYVFLDNLFVNKALVTEGTAKFDDTLRNKYSLQIEQTEHEAKEASRGLWSSLCVNKREGCLIKGNYRKDNNTKIYHLPNCFNYEKTVVNTDEGDFWFCTEEEASRSGFIKSRDCPN